MRRGIKQVLKSAAIKGLIVVTMLQNLVFMASAANAATQNAYHWRNDDGTESTATYNGSENAPLASLAQGVSTRLRFGETNNGSESELLEKASAALDNGEEQTTAAVVDATNGYAYFAVLGNTVSTPAKIIKVALGSGSNPPTKVAVLQLDPGDSYYYPSAVIDAGNGYAYFGSGEAPATILKVALGAGASPPTRVGAATLSSGEDVATAGVIDTANGYAYFGTGGSVPGSFVKVSLGAGASPPSRVNALFLNTGEAVHSAVIDAAGGYAYLGADDFTGELVIKVALGAGASPPTRIGDTGFIGSGSLQTGVIDVANGYAYYACSCYPSSDIRRIILGAGASPPSYDSSLTLNTGESAPRASVIDTANGYAYFGTMPNGGDVPYIAKVRLSDFTEVASTTLDVNTVTVYTMVIDAANGYAYAGVGDSPVYVHKIALGSGDTAPTSIATLEFNPIVADFSTAVLDEANGFAYFGTAFSNDFTEVIAKVALGNESSPPTLVGVIGLDPGETPIFASAIDTTNGFAYFATDTSPGKIIKIDLSTFTRAGTITLGAGEDRPRSAVVDAANGYAYFGLFTAPGQVVKVDINPLHSFAEVGSPVVFASGHNNPRTAVIDEANGFAYFGTLGSSCGSCTPGTNTFVQKVDINPLHTFADVGSLSLQPNISNLRTSVIDPANGYAYFGSQSGKIAKIGLSPFAYVTTITDSDSAYLSSAAIDTINGYAYFGSNVNPGKVYKIDVDPSHTFAETDSLSLSDGKYLYAALVDESHGYAYFGTFAGQGFVSKVSIAPKAKFRLEYGVNTSTCGAISTWTQVPTTATSEDFQMAASANITNGAATTNGAGGVTDGNTVFTPGEIHDTTSQTSEISYGEKQFTEVEYSVKPTFNATPGNAYCFRLTDAGSPSAFTYTNYAEISAVTPGAPPAPTPNTTDNYVLLSREAVNANANATIHFVLNDTLSSQLSVTFDPAFTGMNVSGASALTPSSPGCMSNFTATGANTFTADKSSCTGEVIISGVQVVNPPTPGPYLVSWTNDDSGYAMVAIVDSDQVTVDASVDPSITFDLNTGTTNAPVSAPYSVALGSLTTGAVSHSDNSGVNSVWANLDTNATGGAVVTVLSANAALASLSVPSDTIPNAAASMAAGTANYGLCVNSVTPPSAATGAFQASAPYDSGTCDPAGSANAVKALSTVTPTSILDSAANPVTTGTAEILVNAAISTATAAHSDYADVLTFVATGTF